MEQVLRNKLETVVELVDKAMADPDIDVEYHIPEVVVTCEGSGNSADPFILVKHAEESLSHRKINLSERYQKGSADEIANFVTFSIEQFKEEVESLRYGAQ
jgi:ketopantoate hydroxymethyltransferase